MKIHTLKNGDEVHRFDYSIVIPFQGKRRVLSTAPYNGGYRTDLTTVLNHDGNPGVGCSAEMKGDTYREHMMNTIKEVGLDLKTTTGLETAVHMETAAIHEESYGDLTVAAVITGGIEVNGGRVGDPTTWVEDGNTPYEHRLDTINILLHINADLSEGAMARALVTCTEAKTAALNELMLESHYSRGLATGSGTDGTIVIADMESKTYLTDAGKHSKLGELIGNAVKYGMKEAMYHKSGLCPQSQHDVFKRLSRFGLTEAGLYQYCQKNDPERTPGRPKFAEIAENLARESSLVIKASFLAHAIDQMDWDLLSVEEALAAADELIRSLGGDGITFAKFMENESADTAITEDKAVQIMIESFEKMMVKKILSEIE